MITRQVLGRLEHAGHLKGSEKAVKDRRKAGKAVRRSDKAVERQRKAA